MQQERIYHWLVDTIVDYAILMLDLQGNILSWNTGAQRLMGYLEKEAVGQHFSLLYSPDLVESGFPAYELAKVNEAGRFEHEGLRKHKDGSTRWCHVIITSVKDPAGQPVGYAKITRDLTERRKHQLQIQESEARYRMLVEGVMDYAIFLLDPRGMVSSWNLGAEKIKGYKAEEIIGKPFSLLYPDHAVQSGMATYSLEIAKAEGHFEQEGWRKRKDGSFFWANTSISTLYNDAHQEIGYSVITRDLTSRRLMDEGLRARVRSGTACWWRA